MGSLPGYATATVSYKNARLINLVKKDYYREHSFMSLLWERWEGVGGFRIGFSNSPGSLIPKNNLDSIFIVDVKIYGILYKREILYRKTGIVEGESRWDYITAQRTLFSASRRRDDQTTSRAQTTSWVVCAVVWEFVFVSCSE